MSAIVSRYLDIQRRLNARSALWIALGICLALLMFQTGLLAVWTESEEYGHGLVAMLTLGYLIKRRWPMYAPLKSGNSISSIVVAAVALALLALGAPSGISLIGYYGIWLFGVAAILAMGGMTLTRRLLVPILIVPLMLPLPNPLGPMLTAKLQLISSEQGVWFLRLFGATVYLEGNVIDMGPMKLLVAEACAGLRYLFPLMSLGAIAAVIMRAPLWMRWAVFLATIPITIFMNSFRIAVTGMLVKGGNTAHTEGFLHFFEGWVVFAAAFLLLMVVVKMLSWLLPGKPGLFEILSWNLPSGQGHYTEAGRLNYVFPSRSLLVIVILMLAASIGFKAVANRGEMVPSHRPLIDFPLLIDDWQGSFRGLPIVEEQVAGASEYFHGDYLNASREAVNVYIAYYENQRHGQIPHSPEVCIPGGGWVVESISQTTIAGANGKQIEANRLIATLGGRKIVTYYWLKQGSQTFSQGFLARLALVVAGVVENRTDGALIRLVSEIPPGESLVSGDMRIKRFALEFVGLIPDYVPD